MNRFICCHPAVSALYFLSVLLITIFTANPVIPALVLLGGIAFRAALESKKAFFRNLAFYLPLFILIALTNPLFSHNGVTPLFFMNGNPITREAILYGIDIAAMLIAVMYWFKCFDHIMTSDKLLYLLGKVSPQISLVVSSALRFIPLLREQAERIRQTQKAMGLYTSESWLDKLRGTLRVYSSLIGWSLENAVDTGSAMKGRGYGLKERSHFALFRFTRGDGLLLVIIICLDLIVLLSLAAGKLKFDFYPRISDLEFGIHTLPAMLAVGLLSFLPVILEIKENIQWTYYRSKM